MKSSLLHLSLCLLFLVITSQTFADSPQLVVFEVDASPRIGTPMAYDPAREVTIPLSCRGIVILSDEEPVVLCAVDWLGIANEAHEMFRAKLAEAAKTTPDRVAVHTLHQHDAPRCDGTAFKIMAEIGRANEFYDAELWEKVATSAAQAIQNNLPHAKKFNRIGVGKGEVKEVASNRRILGLDGKVQVTRYTATKDPAIRAMPEGVIDPMLRSVGFFHDEDCLAVLTYYATHPQSYYRTGQANPDFPGMARNQRQNETGLFHVHFNGAGGNIGAGKYNDGSVPQRQVLANRVAEGMKIAWDSMQKHTVDAKDIHWKKVDVLLPLASHLQVSTLNETLKNTSTPPLQAILAAEQLAFVQRTKAKKTIAITSLNLPGVALLHLPGELFVEYQIAASRMRPDIEVLTASYGDYGPFYIGTEVAYPQGGYETSPGASNVSPECEGVLTAAIVELLVAPTTKIKPSDFTQRVP